MDMRSMLDIKYVARGGGLLEARSDLPQAAGLDLRWMVAAVRRRIWTTLLLMMVFASGAVVYVMLRPSHYTAFTQLQLTNLKLTLGQDDAVFAEAQADPTFLETQLAIMRARKIGLTALERIERVHKDVEPQGMLDQGRAEVAELVAPWTQAISESLGGLLPTTIAAFLTPGVAEVQGEKEQRIALRDLQKSYSVQRVGLSNIVEIRFTASTPEHAAFAANEIAQVYIADQDAARAEFAQSGSIWLRERLRDVGTRARIISTAAPPLDKSDMRGIVIIACAGIVGLALGVALSLGRQLLDRTVRTAEDAEAASGGAECLGIVPRIRSSLFRGRERFRTAGAPVGAASAKDRLPDFLAKTSASKVRHVMRNVQAALEETLDSRKASCIGFTATREGEGCSTMAFAFASFLAVQKYRVLLVDCSPGSRSLSALLAPAYKKGLNEALTEQGSSSNFMLEGACSGLHFIPYGEALDEQDLSVIPRSAAMSNFLASIRHQFDAVVLDLPPLTSTGEIRSVVPHLDHVVLVAECGRVEAAHMQAGIKAAGALRDKLRGLVLNKARTREIRCASSGSAFFLLPAKYRASPIKSKPKALPAVSEMSA